MFGCSFLRASAYHLHVSHLLHGKKILSLRYIVTRNNSNNNSSKEELVKIYPIP